MFITSVHATQGGRDGKKFCIHSYSRYDQINLSDVVKLEHEDKNYYFEVIDIKASSTAGDIDFIANEIGYYNLLSKQKIDIRKIIDKDIFVEKDDEILKKLAKERCYC